ncbi:MAG: hypothetical protein ACLRNZ_14760 [Blautia massiliensis (ex Durand et al. 2017)]
METADFYGKKRHRNSARIFWRESEKEIRKAQENTKERKQWKSPWSVLKRKKRSCLKKEFL